MVTTQKIIFGVHLKYIHTYTLLMLPKWAFQLNRIKNTNLYKLIKNVSTIIITKIYQLNKTYARWRLKFLGHFKDLVLSFKEFQSLAPQDQNKWYRALIFTWPYGGRIGVPKQCNSGHVDVPDQSSFFFVPTNLHRC